MTLNIRDSVLVSILNPVEQLKHSSSHIVDIMAKILSSLQQYDAQQI